MRASPLWRNGTLLPTGCWPGTGTDNVGTPLPNLVEVPSPGPDAVEVVVTAEVNLFQFEFKFNVSFKYRSQFAKWATRERR